MDLRAELLHKLRTNPRDYVRGEKLPPILSHGSYKITHPSEINLLTHSHIYDFCQNRFYKCKIEIQHKQFGAPVTSTTLFDNVGNGGRSLSVNEMLESLEDTVVNGKSQAWECALDEETRILAFFPADAPLQNELYVFVNLLRPLCLHEYSALSLAEVEAIEYPATLSRNMHWIWFKIGKRPFPAKAAECVRSWRTLNPELTFHIWCNLPTQEAIKAYFGEEIVGNAEIHTMSDVYACVESELQEHADEFRRILEDPHPNATLLKTDIVRICVLQKWGGWYSDINDTMCLMPLKYVAHDGKSVKRFGADYAPVDVGGRVCETTNNYFMYWDAGNTDIHACLHKEIWQYVPFLHQLIRRNDMSPCALAVFKECLDILRETRQDYILEAIYGQLQRWVTMMNGVLESWGPMYLEHLRMDVGRVLSLISMMWKAMDTESTSLRNWQEELGQLARFNARTGQPVWKEHPRRVPFRKSDIDFLLERLGHKEFDWDTLFRENFFGLFISSLINFCNIGCVMIRSTFAGECIAYPQCGYSLGLSFMSCMTHFGDGTSYGRSI